MKSQASLEIVNVLPAIAASPDGLGEHSKFSAIEDEYLAEPNPVLARVKEGGRLRDPGFADIPHIPAERMRELHDNDLLYTISELRSEPPRSSRMPVADTRRKFINHQYGSALVYHTD